MFEGWSEAGGLWPKCAHNWDETAFRHSVEVWTFAGALHYRLTLFSELHFGGTLATGIEPPFSALYALDVRDPRRKDVHMARCDGTAPPLSGPGMEQVLLEVAEQRFEERTKRLFGETPRYVRAPPPDPQDLYERVKAAMSSERTR